MLVGLIIVCGVFIVTQTPGTYMLPLKDPSGVEAMASKGEAELVLREAEEEDVVAASREFLHQIVAAGGPQKDKASELIDQLNEHSIGELQALYAQDPVASAWLAGAVSNYQYVSKTPDEANADLLEATNGYGYQLILQNKYITYLGAILSFIIVGLAYYFLSLDDKVKSRDTYSYLLGGRKRYFYHQYLAMLLPLLAIFYLLGAALNLYSYLNFSNSGLEVSYLPFIGRYLLFFVPPILLFSSVAAFIMIALKESMSFIPLYILWCVINITPEALAGGRFFHLFVFFKRLDAAEFPIHAPLIATQLLGVVASFVIFEVACRIRLKTES